MFKIVKKNCGYCMSGKTDKDPPQCARYKDGTFDTRYMFTCNEDNCEFLKLLRNSKEYKKINY